MKSGRDRHAFRRFLGRAEEYARGRPSYPAAAVDAVLAAVPGTARRVADVGAGTGLFTTLLVRRGVDVVAVEPNPEMAGACHASHDPEQSLQVVVARAETTGLANHCMDLVTTAQAFHWFDAEAVADEFRRILRPGGSAAVLWNRRRSDGSPLALAYEELLRRHGTDYQQVASKWEDPKALAQLFGTTPPPRTFLNHQPLDRAGLHARVLSSSYMPAPGSPGHDGMLADLNALFDDHATDDRVTLVYDTVVYQAVLG